MAKLGYRPRTSLFKLAEAARSPTRHPTSLLLSVTLLSSSCTYGRLPQLFNVLMPRIYSMDKNHTVTQSTFADPCTQFKNATTGELGLNSGFQAVAAGATQFPVWTIQIAEATPIWMFCMQTKHCANGMVFSINANETSDKSYAAYKARAEATLTSTNTTSSAATPSSTAHSGASRVVLAPVSLALAGLVAAFVL